ncbi:MAG: hypothetical protein MUE34_17625 [Acidimicrobiales bacterium]|jgi:flagellar basal-body rod modification protein FlgD|nr:hypothetical protein [Acidimicrobiales bacterium]
MSSSIAALAASSGLLSTAGTTGGVSTYSKAGATDLYGLDKDDFFTLFLAQLQNQDPTQPMDNAQLVGQLAQFAMIQTLQDVSTSLNGSRLAQAAGLIGKHVTGFDESGTPVNGTVDRVDQSAGGYWLVIGTSRVAPESVATVSGDSTTPAP